MTRRTSRRRTSRRNGAVRQSWMVPEASQGAPFLIDSYDGRKALYGEPALTQRAAMREAKSRGRSDRPAIVWKRVSHGSYRPFAAVVEGKVLR